MPDHNIVFQQVRRSKPVRLELSGSALPEKGGLRKILKLHYLKEIYAGNDEATVQVLTAEARAFKLKGFFCDHLAGVEGFADAASQALESLFLDASPINFFYRETFFRGLIVNLELTEREPGEIEYELEFEPFKFVTSRSSESLDRLAELTRLSARLIEERLAAMEAAFASLPEEIRTVPTSSVVTEADFQEPERIPPPEFILDPWLEFRINAEELRAKGRLVIELIGDERALNASDAAIAVASSAYILASRAKEALNEWDSGGLATIEEIARTENIYAAIAAYEALQLALAG